MEFNETTDPVSERTRTENHEGGEAFEPVSAELKLTKVVINNLLEDSYYESDDEQFAAVVSAFNDVADSNPEFALKLAKYARQEENLRQIPQALLVLASEHRPSDDGAPITEEWAAHYVRDYAPDIMSRTDEPLDVLALWTSRNSKSIPKFLAAGIEDAMHTWNEWQYAKWDQPNREWQYRDLLNLVHPTPQDDERDDIFEKIALGDLDDYDVESLTQEDTWESSLSDDSDDRSKAEKYREQLDEGNMGLFPRIRQARDMLESGVTADEIYGDVTDEWIRNSRLYPFRFYQAYKAINGSPVSSDTRLPYGSLNEEPEISESESDKALEFLEHAMEVSTENLPDVLEDTFVAVDTSGSMKHPVSGDSDLNCIEIGSLFGALLYKRGADVAAFASDIQEFNGDRRDSIPSLMREIQDLPCGGGTSGELVPKALREYNRDRYEQVIVFTDMQMWGERARYGHDSFNEEWKQYRQETNPDANLYLVDLQNYGDLVTPEGAQDVYQLSGWTENVIDFIDNMEHVDDMIREIESVEPSN